MFQREASQTSPLLLPLETIASTAPIATPDIGCVVPHASNNGTSTNGRSAASTIEDGSRLSPAPATAAAMAEAPAGGGVQVPLTSTGAEAVVSSSEVPVREDSNDEFQLTLFAPVKTDGSDIDAAIGGANSAAAIAATGAATDLMASAMGTTAVENSTEFMFATTDGGEPGLYDSHEHPHHHQQQQEPPAKRQRGGLLELELGLPMAPDATTVLTSAATPGAVPTISSPTGMPLVGGWEAVISASATATDVVFAGAAPVLDPAASSSGSPAVHYGGGEYCMPVSAASLALPLGVGGGGVPRKEEENDEEERRIVSVSVDGRVGDGGVGLDRGVATAGAKRSRPAVSCAMLGCNRHPTYGDLGDQRGSYCPAHGKEKGMQNIVTPRCRHHYSAGDMPCPLWPAFGRETDKSPTYCAKHALNGMKNINNPRCRDEDCERWPSFGVPGTKNPVFCVAHKLDGMVDVIKPRCREEGGCSHRPSFGWPFERVPTYCRAHKRLGMVDVANPRCSHHDCDRRPSFGIDGQRPSRCASHRLEGMVDVVKPRCRTPDCGRIAYYKVKGTKGATRCSQHQEKGMVRKG